MKADSSYTPAVAPDPNLSTLIIGLFRGVLYREEGERQWDMLLNLQSQLRDHVLILNLELILDEAEGYAFLRSRPEPTDDDPTPRLPRLIVRRPLSFSVSLLLALLRKRLAEFDAGGGDTRLVLSLDELVELIRVFLPDGSNEVKLIDQIETTVSKVVELGFLHKLKTPTAGGLAHFEVKRILKAFVDAQWLSEFDARLAAYRTAAVSSGNKKESRDE